MTGFEPVPQPAGSRTKRPANGGATSQKKISNNINCSRDDPDLHRDGLFVPNEAPCQWRGYISKKISNNINCSRDDKIRTCDLFVPNEAPYRAGLHPVIIKLMNSIISSLTISGWIGNFFYNDQTICSRDITKRPIQSIPGKRLIN
jgi:hypothetical protein